MNKLDAINSEITKLIKIVEAPPPTNILDGPTRAEATERKAKAREELSMLQEAAKIEEARLKLGVVAEFNANRNDFLNSINTNAETLQVEYNNLTAQLNNTFHQLASLWAQRACLLSSQSIGLDDPQAHELLSRDEYDRLVQAAREIKGDISLRELTSMLKVAFNDAPVRLKESVLKLLRTPPHGYLTEPSELSRVDVLPVQAAINSLLGTPYPVENKQKPCSSFPTPPKASVRQVADLRYQPPAQETTEAAKPHLKTIDLHSA